MRIGGTAASAVRIDPLKTIAGLQNKDSSIRQLLFCKIQWIDQPDLIELRARYFLAHSRGGRATQYPAQREPKSWLQIKL